MSMHQKVRTCLLSWLLLLIAPCLLALEFAEVAWHGFVDGRVGLRLQDDAVQPDSPLGELRAQVWAEQIGRHHTATLRADILYDQILRSRDLDLESGAGWLDLREANLLLAPTPSADLKIGRQILTWGVGDMLFVNDLFPKDWQSFFSGRDEEYLKAPSDALMLSLFPGRVDIDLVYTPRFDADRFISGERHSYWNPLLGRRAGRDDVTEPRSRDRWFKDDEIALRLRGIAGGMEWALYGYHGFWKSPEGVDPASMRTMFPRLSVFGASLRGPLAGGLVSLETGHYDSVDDRSGDDATLPNSQHRGLVGYDVELMRNLLCGLQYYVEYMLDHDDYRDGLLPGMHARDRLRQVITLRLTKLAMNQNLTLSLFAYFSPSDQDAYLRPSLAYKINDNLLCALGANLFAGRRDDTFFGQFEDNSNLYTALRYSF